MYPVLVRTVLATHGFGWSQRAMLLVVLATQVLPCALLRQRPGIPRRAFRLANVVDFSPLRDPRFAVFCAGVFVTHRSSSNSPRANTSALLQWI